MTRKILVIEDSLKHTSDAKKFFESQDADVQYKMRYNRASEVMYEYGLKEGSPRRQIIGCKFDGVISDIYFPLSFSPDWNQPEPIGIRVAIELSQLGTPFVLNTAGFHHGRRFEWINQLAYNQGWTLIDSGEELHEGEADTKNWEKAYKALEEKMAC